MWSPLGRPPPARTPSAEGLGRQTWPSPRSPVTLRSPLLRGSERKASKEMPAVDATGADEEILNVGSAQHGTSLQDPLRKLSKEKPSSPNSAWLEIERQQKELEQVEKTAMNEELVELRKTVTVCNAGLEDLRSRVDSLAFVKGPSQASTQVLEDRISRAVVSIARVDDRVENGLAGLSAELAAFRDKIIKMEDKVAAHPEVSSVKFEVTGQHTKLADLTQQLDARIGRSAEIDNQALIALSKIGLLEEKIAGVTERYRKLFEGATQLEDRISKTVVNGEQANAGLSAMKSKIGKFEDKIAADSAAVYAKIFEVTERYSKLSEVAAQLEEKIQTNHLTGKEINHKTQNVLTALSSEFIACKEKIDNAVAESAAVSARLPEVTERYATLSKVATQLEERISNTVLSGDKVNAALSAEFVAVKDTITAEYGAISAKLPEIHEQYAKLSETAQQLEDKFKKNVMSSHQVDEKLQGVLATVSSEIDGITSYCKERFSKLSGVADTAADNATLIRHVRDKVEHDFAILRKEISEVTAQAAQTTVVTGHEIDAKTQNVLRTVSSELAGVTSYCEERFGKVETSVSQVKDKVDQEFALLRQELSRDMAHCEERMQRNAIAGTEVDERTQNGVAALSAESATVKDKIAAECTAACAQLLEVTERYAKLSEVAAQMEDRFNNNVVSSTQVDEKTQQVLSTVASELAGVSSYCEERFSKAAIGMAQLEGRVDAELSGVASRLDGRINQHATSISQIKDRVDDAFTNLRNELAEVASRLENKIGAACAPSEAESSVRGLCSELQTACRATNSHLQDLENRFGLFEKSQSTPRAAPEPGFGMQAPGDDVASSSNLNNQAWKMENGKWSKIPEANGKVQSPRHEHSPASTKAKSARTDLTERLQQQALQLASQRMGMDHAEQIAEFERRFASRRSLTPVKKEGMSLGESPSIRDLQQVPESNGHHQLR